MDDLRAVYAGLLCNGLRVRLFEIEQVLSGRADGVPFRLRSEQYARAREAISELFHIVGAPELEPAASTIARRDESFQQFLTRATANEDGPVGPLQRQLRGAGRSAAAKRAWARRKAKR